MNGFFLSPITSTIIVYKPNSNYSHISIIHAKSNGKIAACTHKILSILSLQMRSQLCGPNESCDQYLLILLTNMK